MYIWGVEPQGGVLCVLRQYQKESFRYEEHDSPLSIQSQLHNKTQLRMYVSWVTSDTV